MYHGSNNPNNVMEQSVNRHSEQHSEFKYDSSRFPYYNIFKGFIESQLLKLFGCNIGTSTRTSLILLHILSQYFPNVLARSAQLFQITTLAKIDSHSVAILRDFEWITSYLILVFALANLKLTEKLYERISANTKKAVKCTIYDR
jgi:hypothetical protein